MSEETQSVSAWTRAHKVKVKETETSPDVPLGRTLNALESLEREQDCYVRMFLTKQRDFRPSALER